MFNFIVGTATVVDIFNLILRIGIKENGIISVTD